MNPTHTRLLEDLLVAQVISLATQLKMKKKSEGITSTSDFVSEAVALIKKKRAAVLEAFQTAGS
jgi:hypothetical protein